MKDILEKTRVKQTGMKNKNACARKEGKPSSPSAGTGGEGQRTEGRLYTCGRVRDRVQEFLTLFVVASQVFQVALEHEGTGGFQHWRHSIHGRLDLTFGRLCIANQEILLGLRAVAQVRKLQEKLARTLYGWG